ncbi:hypothetical protein C7M84_003353 [Penaeus vannamei]|uniref:Uncharacterized protein n=1 Tax=Penaeus vannamei TaxID=6689 RepID=A0A423TNB8_PENVA|nr:hypothetical protein C7M84_003353 [Penaeus vannamei]
MRTLLFHESPFCVSEVVYTTPQQRVVYSQQQQQQVYQVAPTHSQQTQPQIVQTGTVGTGQLQHQLVQPQQLLQSTQQPSQVTYLEQEHYLKQLENKITTQQKGVGRGKVIRPSAEKRKMLSQQLGNPQQQQQQQQQQKQQGLVSRPGQAMVQRGPGVVGPVNQSPQVQQGTTNDEVRIPLSTNNTLNEQYYYVQRADGSRILAVVSLNQGASNTTAQQSNTSTVTTMAGSQVVSPSNPPVSIAAKTPPLQEQTVHSTVSTEQTDAEGNGKRRFIKGRVAVCSNCGILSEDLLTCQRCNHRTDTARTLAQSTITTSGKSSTADSTVVGGRGVGFSNMHIMKQGAVSKRLSHPWSTPHHPNSPMAGRESTQNRYRRTSAWGKLLI